MVQSNRMFLAAAMLLMAVIATALVMFYIGRHSLNDRLCAAVRQGNLTAGTHFLRQGADPNTTCSSVPLLLLAVRNRDASAVDLLLLYGADVNTKTTGKAQFTALMEAADNDDLPTVDILLQHHADVRFSNRYGASALSLARDMNRSTKLIGRLQNALRK